MLAQAVHVHHDFGTMPYYMDRHELAGVTAADIAAAHMQDLQIQNQFGVQYVNYWFDYEAQHAFCLAERTYAQSRRSGPSRLAWPGGNRNHRGRRVGRASLHGQIGDSGAMAVLRRHDAIVRAALEHAGGTEVKHTGDGIMASFPSVAGAIEGAISIQHGFAQAETEGYMPVGVRIGIAAGEPVTDRDDLFGTAFQLAARLSSRAGARTILVAGAVRDLALGKGFQFGPTRNIRLKGFDDSVRACEVTWRAG